MIPFAADYTLWHNGLAGSIVSMAAFVIGTVFIYRLVFLMTKKSWIGMLAAVLYALNINILYLQTTAMTEVILYGALSVSLFYFVKWVYEKKILDLVAAGFATALATLVRYEAWLVLVFCLAFIYFENYRTKTNRKRAGGRTFMYGTLGAFGVFIWLLWNLVFFGSPLYFLTGQAGQYSLGGHSSANRHHLFQSLESIVRGMGYNIGFVALGLVAIAAVYLLVRKRSDKRILVYVLLLLAAPILVNLVTLLTGTTNIKAASIGHLVDVRYAIAVVPAAAVISALAINALPKLAKPAGTIVALGLLLAVSNTAYSSAISGGRGLSKNTIEFANAFQKDYRGGNILASTGAVDPVMQKFGIPLKNYIYEGNGNLWKQSLIHPGRSSSWILMSKNVSHDPVYDAFNAHHANYADNFIVVYQKSGFVILAKKSLNLPAFGPAMKTVQKYQISKKNTSASVVTPALQRIVVVAGDSESTIVRREIRVLDHARQLSGAQEAYIEGVMVYYLDADNLIHPGQVIIMDTSRLASTHRGKQTAYAGSIINLGDIRFTDRLLVWLVSTFSRRDKMSPRTNSAKWRCAIDIVSEEVVIKHLRAYSEKTGHSGRFGGAQRICIGELTTFLGGFDGTHLLFWLTCHAAD